MIVIPKQLQKPQFRFYLCGYNNTDWAKRAIEKRWTTDNNYQYNDPRLLNHNGNYGVVCGIGRLVVLDFDDLDYYNEVKGKLPETFTVLSARRGLPHMYYYYLNDMVRKLSVRDDKERTLLDIQAAGSGVVGPGSRYGYKFYRVDKNLPIAYLSQADIMDIFKVVPKHHTARRISFSHFAKEQPEKIKRTIEVLTSNKIERTMDRHFRCALHEMSGNGNLYVMDDGAVYCFHTQKYWKTPEQYLKEVENK